MFRERPREGRPFREAKRVRFPFSSTNFIVFDQNAHSPFHNPLSLAILFRSKQIVKKTLPCKYLYSILFLGGPSQNENGFSRTFHNAPGS